MTFLFARVVILAFLLIFKLLNLLFSCVNENVVYLRVLPQKFFQTADTFAGLSRAYAYGLQRSFYGPTIFRSKVSYLGFFLCKRPQRGQYQSYTEVGSTTEGSGSPQFVKSCHMRKPYVSQRI